MLVFLDTEFTDFVRPGLISLALVSEDVKNVSPQIYASICSQLGDIPIEAIQHKDFKLLTVSAKAVIRTGEFTPYANVILVSGAWGFGV